MHHTLFQYVQNNKESDNDWFRLESNKEGTRWFGKCWHIHELLKYEFDVEFDVSKMLSCFLKLVVFVWCILEVKDNQSCIFPCMF